MTRDRGQAAARLLKWFDAGTLLPPSSVVPNTVDLARALGRLAAAPGVPSNDVSDGVAKAIGTADHYVFILVDGLGMNLVESLPARAFLRRHTVMEMRAVFPSSTAPALTSLATASWPAAHGIPGWWVYFPERDISATVLPFVERFSPGRPLQKVGMSPDDVYTRPSLAPRIPGFQPFQPTPIAGSTTGQYFFGGLPTTGYDGISSAGDAVVAHLAGASAQTYSYLYIPFVDAAQHEHGVFSPAARHTLAQVETMIESLVSHLPTSSRVIVSADHGLVDIPADRQQLLERGEPLLEALLAPPSCDQRVPMFHVRPGASDRFVAAFELRCGDRFALLSIDEAQEMQLFGPEPIAADLRSRFGDYIAIGDEPDALLFEPEHPMLGFHGGMLPDEMRIPLIVI